MVLKFPKERAVLGAEGKHSFVIVREMGQPVAWCVLRCAGVRVVAATHGKIHVLNAALLWRGPRLFFLEMKEKEGGGIIYAGQDILKP